MSFDDLALELLIKEYQRLNKLPEKPDKLSIPILQKLLEPSRFSHVIELSATLELIHVTRYTTYISVMAGDRKANDDKELLYKLRSYLDNPLWTWIFSNLYNRNFNYPYPITIIPAGEFVQTVVMEIASHVEEDSRSIKKSGAFFIGQELEDRTELFFALSNYGTRGDGMAGLYRKPGYTQRDTLYKLLINAKKEEVLPKIKNLDHFI